MAKYLKHTIMKPETLQAIATLELSDTSRWTEIAELNGLKYPYIVPTNADKRRDPVHLRTYGDVIDLPTLNSIVRMDVDTMDDNGQKRTYDMSMGMDISLNFDWQMGGDDDLMFMHPAQDHHDIATVAGIENLKESLQKRLNTQYGSLMYHPKYGTHLIEMLGKKLTPTLVEDLKVEILRTVKTDSRVSSVSIENFIVPDGRRFFCLIAITPLSGSDAFNMFVTRAQDGTINIGG